MWKVILVWTAEVEMREGDEIEKIGKMIPFLRDGLMGKPGVGI